MVDIHYSVTPYHKVRVVDESSLLLLVEESQVIVRVSVLPDCRAAVHTGHISVLFISPHYRAAQRSECGVMW